MKVYIGYDEREKEAARVAAATLCLKTDGDIVPELLDAQRLANHGLLTRISDHRGEQDYDLVSNAPKSTRFAISRFLVPMLCQSGYALYVDCDVVFLTDPRKMLPVIGAEYAVNVVKHTYEPTSSVKMINQKQLPYARKNWSSVMLFNCDHPANQRLTLHDVNHGRGLLLHQFYWLHDSEIGELPAEWNWLVGEQPKPTAPKIAHFTLGGPWLPNWPGAEHDDLWLRAAEYSKPGLWQHEETGRTVWHQYPGPSWFSIPMMYEDELPEGMSDEDYAAWFELSTVPDGIGCRIGPRV